MDRKLIVPTCTETLYEDYGHGVQVQRRYMDGVLAGIAYDHSRPDGTECPGGKGSWVPVKSGGSDPGRNEWDLRSEEPLHLEPSLLCRICGHHGFIRNGRWEPA